MSTVTQVDIRETRLARLTLLLHEYGSKKALAAKLKKAPAQVSQWFNRVRTITEDSAREIERNAERHVGWLDLPVSAETALPRHAHRAEEPKANYRTWPFSVAYERFERTSPALKAMVDQQLSAAVAAYEADHPDKGASEKRRRRD